MNDLSQYEQPHEIIINKDDFAGYASADDAVHNNSRASCKCRGVPWTEEEHMSFLLGLQKQGKGDWRGISRNFVVTRTPTQVASHAQKYFIRQINMNRRRRRSSLFDIVVDGNDGDDGNDRDNNGGDGGDGDDRDNRDNNGGDGGDGDDRDNNGGDGGGGDGGDGDDGDNNGGGGDKNKKGGGSGDGEGNGDGGDRAEGGDGKEKGTKKDCTGQLGFGYRCTYHAGYENGYPVEQLNALKMFCSENMIK